MRRVEESRSRGVEQKRRDGDTVGATPASPALPTATLPAIEDDAEAFICEACQ